MGDDMNRPAAVTASERSLRAQDVVNAADGWAGEVAALAGLTVMGKRNKTTYRVDLGGDRPVILRIAAEPGRQTRSERELPAR